MTNNAIGSVSYSNSTLPLPSSSTFVGVYKMILQNRRVRRFS
ncbi:MAG TPA: hypothetical protein VKA95_01135 [Nitrososphaeraceae archaeon]|nr:hypothetical protein [Nitrososphaeraceae archaeon]